MGWLMRWPTVKVGCDDVARTLRRQHHDAVMTKPSGKTLRVLYVTPGGVDGRGGMGRMARYLIAAFRAYTDIEVRALDPYGPGAFTKMPFYFAGSLLRLAAACARSQVDVAHIHMAYGGSTIRKLLLLRVADLFGVPTILHLHGSEFAVFAKRLSPRLRAILVAAMMRAARIVVIGSFWREFLVQDLGISDAKVVVVANGVPLPPTPSPKATGEPCRIVYLG